MGPGFGDAGARVVPTAAGGATTRPVRAWKPRRVLRAAPSMLGRSGGEFPHPPDALERHAREPLDGEHAPHKRRAPAHAAKTPRALAACSMGAGEAAKDRARHEPGAAGVVAVEDAAHHFAAGIESNDGRPAR